MSCYWGYIVNFTELCIQTLHHQQPEKEKQVPENYNPHIIFYQF